MTGPGSKEDHRLAAGSVLAMLLIAYVVAATLTEAQGKGMGRGVNRNGASARTYLKKFGNRNVVYQRKIFNTKYHNGDDIGTVGSHARDKFKRRLSDGDRKSSILRLKEGKGAEEITPAVPDAISSVHVAALPSIPIINTR